jgi:hypothetical protein
MGYCGNKWPSSYTWTNIIAGLRVHFGNAFSLAASSLAVTKGQPMVFVGGSISGDSGSIDSTLALDAPADFDAPPAGEYAIVLLNGAGGVISSTSFGPAGSSEGSSSTFAVNAPAPGSVARIELRKSSAVLDTVEASASAPQVALLDPLGGQTFTGPSVPLHWNGSDADGDVLDYVVQFSANSGLTWSTVAADLDATTINVDRSTLSGTTHGRFRVIASDGLLTAMAASTSDITIAGNPPDVMIVAPAGGEHFAGGPLLVGQAIIHDGEDGEVSAASITWSSDRDGVLGTGADLAVSTDTMTEGVHIITAAATDSDGMQSSSTVTVTVLRTLDDTPLLYASQPTLSFNAILGDPAAIAGQYLSLGNAGFGELQWTVTASQPWLTAGSLSGTTPGALSIAVAKAGLGAGEHTANLHFTAGSLVVDVPVTLTITNASGDTDCDGATGAPDALRVLRIVAGLTTQPAGCNADANGDGEVTLGDSLWVLHSLAGLPNP